MRELDGKGARGTQRCMRPAALRVPSAHRPVLSALMAACRWVCRLLLETGMQFAQSRWSCEQTGPVQVPGGRSTACSPAAARPQVAYSSMCQVLTVQCSDRRHGVERSETDCGCSGVVALTSYLPHTAPQSTPPATVR